MSKSSYASSCFSTILLVLTLASTAFATDPCRSTNPIQPTDVVRDSQLSTEPACYTVDLRDGSFLAEVVAAETVVPRLDVYQCPNGGGTVLMNSRQPSAFNARSFNAGRYALCVSAQNSAHSWLGYKLITAHAPAPAVLWGGTRPAGDPEEEEPEPDPTSGSPLITIQGDPEEEEPEPDPTSSWMPMQNPMEDLCRDAGDDAFRCAVPLGLDSAVEAEIRNDWADDTDTYLFRLRTVTTIQVLVDSPADLAVSLYNAEGLRVAVERVESGFLQTLPAGHYYIRLGGRFRSEGNYRLQLERLN